MNTKISLLSDYFKTSDPEDAIWVVYFLSGHRFKRLFPNKLLRHWVMTHYSIPKWLFTEAMVAVGDTGETISLLIDSSREPLKGGHVGGSLSSWIRRIRDLSHLTEDQQEGQITHWWKTLSQEGIFLINKLMTGAFRLGVSKQTVANGLAQAFSLEKTTILHRMMGKWEPTKSYYKQLTSQDESDTQNSHPYPFYLASPLEKDIPSLGSVSEWFFEWKWDGIRAQFIRRYDEVFLWSRGEELINISFPLLILSMREIPNGTVFDGEILAYYQGKPLAFSVLQRRIGRQDINDTILSEAPVIFMIYDLLEFDYDDLRKQEHSERRRKLEKFQKELPDNFKISPLLAAKSWDEVMVLRDSSRNNLAEGLMLKRKLAEYQVGRKRGDWYKYKVDPLSIDAVLIYAQTGSGRRANLFTAYTFAVWSDDHDELITIGRAYSGLTDKEFKELDAWIRSNTQQRFGPVRSVDPIHVFELGFDGIMTNEKSKSGMSLRFPRMLRWRKDKPVEEADTISTTRLLLKFEGITEIKRNRSLDEFFL